MYIALAASMVLAIGALLLLFAAIAHFGYPQSQTTIEVYPTDFTPPRRWGKILTYAGLGAVLAVTAVALFFEVYVPAQRLVAVEDTVRQTFREKLKREPTRTELHEVPSPEWFCWSYKGTAWLKDDDVWDVTVTWSTVGWECRAIPRP